MGKLALNSSKVFSVSINKFLVTELVTVQVSQISKLDVKNVNTVKSTTCRYMFKCNRMFETKNSKINQLQKTIEYQTNKQSTNYSN